MKLPLPFKRDAATRLRAETAASASAAAKLAELRNQRDAVLHGDHDDLVGVVAADAAVSAQEAICRVHQERLAQLDRELATERTAERQKRKAAAIEVIVQNFAARTSAAEKLERALANLAAAYNGCVEASRNATAGWDGRVLPPLRGEFATTDNIAAWLAATLRIEPASAHVMLSEAGVRTEGFAQRQIAFAESFLVSLRAAPLPETFDDDQEAAA
jgi:hypothetical protein